MRTNGAFLRTSFDSPRRNQGHPSHMSSPDPSSQGGAAISQDQRQVGQVPRSQTPSKEVKEEPGSSSQVRSAIQQLTQDRSVQDPTATKPKFPGQPPQVGPGSGPRKIITKAIIEHQSIRNRPLPAIPNEEKDENKNLTPGKTASLGRRNEPPRLVKTNQQILTKAELQQHIQSQLNVIYWTTSSSSG